MTREWARAVAGELLPEQNGMRQRGGMLYTYTARVSARVQRSQDGESGRSETRLFAGADRLFASRCSSTDTQPKM